MKTICVKAVNGFHAHREMEELVRILEDSTPIKARSYPCKKEVRTEHVTVRFYTCNRLSNTDGIRCDIPCRFGDMGKMMAKGRKFPKLETIKEIAKYIVEEEMR